MASSKKAIKDPNVVLKFTGIKTKGGKPVKDDKGNYVVAKVFGVKEKLKKEDIDKQFLIPEKLGDLPTDVIQVGTIKKRPLKNESAEPQQKRIRPMVAGTSIGHPDITAGTGGYIGVKKEVVVEKQSLSFWDKLWVWILKFLGLYGEYPEPPPDPVGNRAYIVSNNHVLACENNASIGDVIIQPGKYDGGILATDIVAKLDSFVKIKSENNLVDVAVADIIDGTKYSFANYGIENFDTEVVEAEVGMEVCKFGRTTGYTAGRIIGVDAEVSVEYDFGIANFVDQVIIEPGGFSDGGDSGSLIFTMEGNPVALLFAGSDSITCANKMTHVVRLTGVYVG